MGDEKVKAEERAEPSSERWWEVERAQVRQLVEIYYDVQDVRIRSFNRLRQVGQVEGVNPDHLKELEKEIRAYIKRWLRGIPIAEWLLAHKGIGPILAGGLISYFDPRKAKHASSFWRYAGLHVVDGRAPRLKRGQKPDFNPKVRVLCWKVGMSFLKANAEPWRSIYDEGRRMYSEKLNHPEEDPTRCPRYAECVHRLAGKAKRLGRPMKKPPCKLHIHQMALRRMVKVFLAEFWAAWRRMEGLPITEPYAVAVLGHQKRYKLGEGGE